MEKLKHPIAGQKLWPREFLELVREDYTDYRRNPIWRGTTTQLFREVDGLFHLQSSVCKYGAYSHCFAVSATNSKRWFGPFGLGGWFDHNYVISDGFERDLGAVVRGPKRLAGLHSTHSHRTGFESIVRTCTSNAERLLAPHYRAVMKSAAPTLLACLEFAEARAERLSDEEWRKESIGRLGMSEITAKEVVTLAAGWPQRDAASLAEAIVGATAHRILPHRQDFQDIARRLSQIA